MGAPKPCLGYPSRTAAALALQAGGLSNAAIAAMIGIGSSTVTALTGRAERPHQKLTSDQIDDLIERRERGWSYERLAQRYGVTPGAIHYQCLKHGAVSPHQRRTETPVHPTVHTTRAGKQQRRFTADEDRVLLALEAEGLKVSEIARRLGRPVTSTRVRLMMLALREDLPA